MKRMRILVSALTLTTLGQTQEPPRFLAPQSLGAAVAVSVQINNSTYRDLGRSIQLEKAAEQIQQQSRMMRPQNEMSDALHYYNDMAKQELRLSKESNPVYPSNVAPATLMQALFKQKDAKEKGPEIEQGIRESLEHLNNHYRFAAEYAAIRKSSESEHRQKNRPRCSRANPYTGVVGCQVP